MRLLSILHYTFFGGPHNHTLRMANVLARRGVETIAVLPDDPGNAAKRLMESGVHTRTLSLHRARRNPISNARSALSFIPDVQRLRRLIRETKADVIQINGAENPHGAIAGYLEGIGVVWQLVGPGMPSLARRGIVPIIRRLSGAVMIVGENLSRYYPGISSLDGRLISFYPPIDHDVFDPEKVTGNNLREKFNIAPNDLVVGTTGNINPAKAHHHFIQAAALVKQEVPNARFVITGHPLPTQRSLYKNILALIDQLGMQLGKEIIIYTTEGDVREALAMLDVYVQSSVAEGVSGAMLEAMAMRKPLVVTDVGCTSDVVKNEEHGFLVEPSNPKQLASRIVWLLQNPERAGQMGWRNRHTTLQQCTMEQCADRHMEAYEIAIAHARKHRQPHQTTKVGPR